LITRGDFVLAVSSLINFISVMYLLALRLAARTVARLGAPGLPWGVCDLADRLLLQRREDEQPIGAARGL